MATPAEDDAGYQSAPAHWCCGRHRSTATYATRACVIGAFATDEGIARPVGSSRFRSLETPDSLRSRASTNEGGADRATLFFCPARGEAAPHALMPGTCSFPSTAGARLNSSLRRRALAPLACLRAYVRAARSRASELLRGSAPCMADFLVRLPGARLISSLKRRALAPLACLRAIRRGGAVARVRNCGSQPGS